MIAVCIAISPHYLFTRNEGGISNFGTHASTVVFYSLAFLWSAGCLWRAAQSLPTTNSYKVLKLVFITSAISLLIELVTTYSYKINAIYDQLHLIANVWYALFVLASSCWVALAFRFNWRNIFLLGCVLLSLVLMAQVLFGKLHILMVTQLLLSTFVGLLFASSTINAAV